MEWQDFFKLLHVITFVYWVGADIGVFYAARLVVNPQYTPQTRANILKILDWIDQIPRYMLLATFPVGATLAANLAISPITGFWLYAVWIVAIGWMWVITHLHKHHGKPKALAQADLAARALLIAALVVTGIMSINGDGPFLRDWLGWKVLLFGCAVACGFGIRIAFRPFGPAFAQLMKEGSSPPVEAAMKKALDNAVPFVIGIWVFASAAAFLGLSHERLFGS